MSTEHIETRANGVTVRYIFDPEVDLNGDWVPVEDPGYKCVHGHPLFNHCSEEQV